MVITHHGGQCFKVTFGDLTLVFDPIGKGASLPSVRFGADVALVSRNHPDMNGVSEVTYGDKVPFAVTGPGEYERQGVTIQGFLSNSMYGLKGATERERGSTEASGPNVALNTIYAVELEDMTLVHLGALSEKEIPAAAREGIKEVDVLFVPVGGDGVLAPGEAHEIAVSLEPKIIIPMHWSGMGAPKSLETFLKESGNGSDKTDKLTLKKKDLIGKDGSILVITP